MNRLVRGGFGGILATVTMSAVMFGGQALGLFETPPPKQITGRAERKAGAHPALLPDELFQVSWLASHFGFGASVGAVYGLLRPILPRSPVLSGLIYGGAVWAVSYLGIMPALGLYPPPEKDNPARTGVTIAAHAVYGVTLAQVNR